QIIALRTECQHRVRRVNAPRAVWNLQGIFRQRAHFARSGPNVEAGLRVQVIHHQIVEGENGVHDMPALADHIADDLEDRLGSAGYLPQMTDTAVHDDGVAWCKSELLERRA